MPLLFLSTGSPKQNIISNNISPWFKTYLKLRTGCAWRNIFFEAVVTSYHYLSDWNTVAGCFPPEKLLFSFS